MLSPLLQKKVDGLDLNPSLPSVKVSAPSVSVGPRLHQGSVVNTEDLGGHDGEHTPCEKDKKRCWWRCQLGPWRLSPGPPENLKVLSRWGVRWDWSQGGAHANPSSVRGGRGWDHVQTLTDGPIASSVLGSWWVSKLTFPGTLLQRMLCPISTGKRRKAIYSFTHSTSFEYLPHIISPPPFHKHWMSAYYVPGALRCHTMWTPTWHIGQCLQWVKF